MTTDGPPNERPWDDERIPLGIPAETLFHRAISEGTSRRRHRRQRRAIAASALGVALVLPVVVAFAGHATSKHELTVTASSTVKTEKTTASSAPVSRAGSSVPSTAAGATTVPALVTPTTSGATTPTTEQVTTPSTFIDRVTVPSTVVRTTTPTTKPPPPAPHIASVKFTGNTSSPTVTVTGSGFGTAPTPSETDLGFCGGGTGFDYPPTAGGTYNSGPFTFAIDDITASWSAGRGDTAVQQGNCVGLIIQTWSPTSVQFGFGSAYGELTWSFAPGDQYRMWIQGLTRVGAFAMS